MAVGWSGDCRVDCNHAGFRLAVLRAVNVTVEVWRVDLKLFHCCFCKSAYVYVFSELRCTNHGLGTRERGRYRQGCFPTLRVPGAQEVDKSTYTCLGDSVLTQLFLNLFFLLVVVIISHNTGSVFP